MMKLVSAALFALVLAACASIEPVAYTPNPGRIADPRAEARELILANTVGGCIAEPEFSETMLIVKFVCTGDSSGVGNAVVRFNEVETITLQQSGEWYRVRVHHTGGAPDFDWTSNSLADMQRLADAFTALSSAGPSPAPVGAATL